MAVGDTINLQKNARCPCCAGSLMWITEPKGRYIWCIDCHSLFEEVDFGFAEGEHKVEVIKEGAAI